MSRVWANRIGYTLVLVAAANFFGFMAHSAWLGGSAAHGKRDRERYFVGEHGEYTEVTRRQWVWNRIQGFSLFVTHPLVLFVGGPLLIYAYRERPADPQATPG